MRDWECHLDVTQRALVGTLGLRVEEATAQVISVGALSMGFQRMLRLVWSRCLPSGLHECEGSAVSVTALGAVRSAVARVVWSKKLPVTNTLALLSFLDPFGVLTLHIWRRFRQGRVHLLLD